MDAATPADQRKISIMPELRSLSIKGFWHVVRDNTVICAIKQRALCQLRSSDAVRTEITEAELQAAIITKTFLYQDKPVKLCAKCIEAVQPTITHNSRHIPRIFITMRLLHDDFRKLQDIGRLNNQSRHQALCNLVPIVQELTLPDQREQKRQPLRVGIPLELNAVIRKSAEQNGQNYVEILMAAVNEYYRRNS